MITVTISNFLVDAVAIDAFDSRLKALVASQANFTSPETKNGKMRLRTRAAKIRRLNLLIMDISRLKQLQRPTSGLRCL